MSMTIATYNIHKGLQLKSVADNVRELSRRGADLVCLQEAQEFDDRPPLINTLAEALGGSWKAETFLVQNSYGLGLAIFWKPGILHAVKTERLLLPKLEKFNFYENIVEKVVIRFVTSPVQRGALIMTFNVAGRTFRVSNLHLDPHGHFRQRGKQLACFAEYLHKQEEVDCDVVCGDFNTIGAALLFNAQENKLRNILGQGFFGAPLSRQSTAKPFQRLDYIFVKGGGLERSEILKLPGSDHFPVMATITP